MTNRFTYFAALALVSTQAACVSMSSLQTAETLEKGRRQTVFGGGSFTQDVKLGDENLTTQGGNFEAMYREGLGDNLDAGLKLTLSGALSADAKYRLVNGDAFDLSVGGGLGYMSYKVSSSATVGDSTGGSSTASNEVKFTTLDFMIPFYASYRFNDNFAVYGNPRYVFRASSKSGSESGSANQNLIGGAAGVKIGKEWGTYLEASYQKDTGSDFSLMQYTVALFWENPGGFVSNLF